jgi:superfamily II helicase
MSTDPQVDAEMYAIAMCVEELEPLISKPRSLTRVLNFLADRYIENMKSELARLDAEIKVVNERLARQKYDALENADRIKETGE